MKQVLIVGIAVAIGAAGGIAGMVAMGTLAIVFLALLRSSGHGDAGPGRDRSGDDALVRLAAIGRFVDDARRGGLLDAEAARTLDREVALRRHRILSGLPEVADGRPVE